MLFKYPSIQRANFPQLSSVKKIEMYEKLAKVFAIKKDQDYKIQCTINIQPSKCRFRLLWQHLCQFFAQFNIIYP
eukprot:UN25741